MRIEVGSPVSFGYSNILKTEWRKGHLPSVKYGFYGEKLTQKNLSLEHLQAHSKGGKTVLSNLVLAAKEAKEAEELAKKNSSSNSNAGNSSNLNADVGSIPASTFLFH